MTKRTCLLATASLGAVLALAAGTGTVENSSARNSLPKFSRAGSVPDDSRYVPVKVYEPPAVRSSQDDDASGEPGLSILGQTRFRGLDQDSPSVFQQQPIEMRALRKTSGKKALFPSFSDKDSVSRGDSRLTDNSPFKDTAYDSDQPSFGWLADQVLREERTRADARGQNRNESGSRDWMRGDLGRSDIMNLYGTETPQGGSPALPWLRLMPNP